MTERIQNSVRFWAYWQYVWCPVIGCKIIIDIATLQCHGIVLYGSNTKLLSDEQLTIFILLLFAQYRKLLLYINSPWPAIHCQESMLLELIDSFFKLFINSLFICSQLAVCGAHAEQCSLEWSQLWFNLVSFVAQYFVELYEISVGFPTDKWWKNHNSSTWFTKII